MKTLFTFALVLAATTAAAEEKKGFVPRTERACDLTVNPVAEDGHFPLPSRFTVVSDTNEYEAHATTVMLPDEKTVFAFWDIRQGGPCGYGAVSADAGRTWTDISDRLPAEFRRTYDTPFAFRFVDPKTGKGRIRVFSSYGTASKYSWRGPDERPLAEAMPSILSEDDGKTWRMMPPLGADFACVNCFSGAVRLKDGSYLAVFMRGPNPNGWGFPWSVLSTVSRDGGLTWEKPRPVASPGHWTSEPTLCVSPDGEEVCCLMANKWGKFGSYVCVSRDGGATWSKPRELAAPIAGARHAVTTLTDGRYFATFRRGKDVWGWTGPYKSLRNGTGADGVQIRLFNNYGEAEECGNTGVHALKDGTILAVTHTAYSPFRPLPAIVSVRFTADDVAAEVEYRETALHDFENWKPFAKSDFRPLAHGRQYGPFAQALILKWKPGSDHMGDNALDFRGRPQDVELVSGNKFAVADSKTGVYPVDKFRGDNRGDAAVMSWTVKVEKDCAAKLRIHAAPAYGCWLRGTCLRAINPSELLDPTILDVELKQGENEILVLLANPTYLHTRPPNVHDPLQIALALSGVEFTCVDYGRNIELKDLDNVSIDDDFGAGL